MEPQSEKPALPKHNKLEKNLFKRRLYQISGILLCIIGAVGIITPVLPTTGFIVAAAWCFARSSPTLNRWLSSNKILGPYLAVYTQKKGLSLGRKLWILAVLWLGMGFSIALVPALWLKITLAAIALAVSLHILTIDSPRQALEKLQKKTIPVQYEPE